jgi:signal transduction histidine kinase
LLVEAEICRLNHDFANAIDLYDRAIATAKAAEFLQDEALANELAAKFYLGWRKETVAAGYLQEAYYTYARWGAQTKTDALEHRYPKLLSPILQTVNQPLNVLETLATLGAPQRSIHVPEGSSDAGNRSLNTALDFATVLKAAQTLSGTMELEELLRQLTQIILQNSGGDRCALVLPDENGTWQLAALATPAQADLCNIPLALSLSLPTKLIQFVKNTQESIVIHDPKTPYPIADDYLEQHAPQSILCMPILNQTQLIGVLYLENQAVSHVFTSDRLLVLNFFCNQAAISLENARLYRQAQTYAQQLEKAQLQTVQQEKMASLGQLVAGVAHEINNPINFIYGNLKPAEDYMHDLLTLLDCYQSACEAPPAVQNCMEEIDLDFLQEDLPRLMDSMKLGADRIRKIVLSLRNFSRLDEADVKAVDIHEGLDSTLLILQHRLKANDCRPEITIVKNYQTLPLVECYAGQLNQVFMNLLANAIDALEEMHQTLAGNQTLAAPQQITLTTALINDGQAVSIRIRDNGMGMTEDVKAHIFDHLFTTKEVGKGTGLGLAIAQSIVVEKHQGTLVVNSQWGEGAEFVITLPVKMPGLVLPE